MLFLGCDSGATKAAFTVAADDGRVLAQRSFPGVSIVTDGIDGYRDGMRAYLSVLLREAGVEASALTSAAFGLTGYGESRTAVADMQAVFGGVLGDVRCILANDSVMGWSGALRCQPGICIASGTGSVAYGENAAGIGARAGGWSIRFADEGSAYWVATQAIKAFFHQADGREAKTALYDAFMELFEVEEPLHACGEVETLTEGGNYSRVAKLQRTVLKLYQQGDPAAREIYRQAARELYELAAAIKRTLQFPANQPVPITYAGGLFRAGECVLGPLRELVEQNGDTLVAPAFGPLAGAAGYAARDYVSKDALENLMLQVDQRA